MASTSKPEPSSAESSAVNQLKNRARRALEPVGRGLAAIGLTPNALTIIGCLLNFGVAAVIGSGQLVLGGALVLVVNAFDMLDGAVARATGRSTKFGAFLDSTLDRFSEVALFLGLVVYGAIQSDLTIVVLSYAAAMGSLLVSYARARAEGLGLRCDVGLLQRPERIIVLGIGLILGLQLPVLWLLAVLTNYTAIQRVIHVWKLTGGR